MRWWRNLIADTDGLDRQGEVVDEAFMAQRALDKGGSALLLSGSSWRTAEGRCIADWRRGAAWTAFRRDLQSCFRQASRAEVVGTKWALHPRSACVPLCPAEYSNEDHGIAYQPGSGW